MAVSITDLYRILFSRTKLFGGNVIDMGEHGRAGGVNTGQGHKFIRDVDERLEIDESAADTTYIGRAKMGASTDSADWQILKISESSGVQSFKYADGDDGYDNVYDDRASLDYS